FFFQAEDGIRDATVTGVQTCALPIYRPRFIETGSRGADGHVAACHFAIKLQRSDVRTIVLLRRRADLEADLTLRAAHELAVNQRSEERRVGKERKTRGVQDKYTTIER